MKRAIPCVEGVLRCLWRVLPGGTTRDARRPRDHVRWLRERLFRCEDAEVAEVHTRLGRPVAERLTTTTDGTGTPLQSWLECMHGTQTERRAVLGECGVELGRMHALGFVHGALTPAGLRVFPDAAHGGPGHGRRVSFCAIGAGGLAPWLRGRALTRAGEFAALLGELTPHLDRDDEVTLVQAYAEGRRRERQPQ